MPVPVVATSPARVVGTTAGANGNTTSASFTPPGDSVLVATVHKDGTVTASSATFSNTGTALTWIVIDQQNYGGNLTGGVASAYAVVPTGGIGSTTVSGRINGNANQQSLKVDVVTGVDLSDPLGLVATSGAPGTATNDLTVTNSFVWEAEGSSLVFFCTTGTTPGVADSVVPTSATFGAGNQWSAFVDSGNYRGARGYKTSVDGETYLCTCTTGSVTLSWSYIVFEIKGVTALPITGAGDIASAAAVGSATVTVGDVSVTPTGIAGGTAVGTARVDLNISTSGIASTEAFGAATVNAGIITASITHTHPVGSATVTVGDVNISGAGGIAHTHPFGTPTILGSVLYLTGIPGGSTVGSATITTGPVNLVATGIPHTHGMGTTTVTRVTSALTTEIVIRPRPRTTYELTMVARIPQPNTLPVFMELESLAWSNLSYSQKLSTPDTLDVTIKLSTLTEVVKQRLRTPAEMPTELWLYRNGKLVFAGPLLGGEMQGEDLRLSANGCLNYLMWMFVSKDLIWKNTDMFTIMKGLVDHWQSAPYGNFGIDTSNVGECGVLMDASYIRDELNIVYDLMMNQGQSNNGFDVTIDPVTRGLEFYYPRRGVNRSSGPEAVVFDDRNVTDTNVTFSVSPKDLATEVASVSSSSGPDAVTTFFSWWTNPEWLQKFGRVGAVNHFRDVTTQAQSDQLNLGMLFSRNQTLWIPGPNVRVTPDSDLDTYDVGDTVSYQLHNELGIQGNFRILARSIDVDENSNESVSVSFV